jgi:serine phosphatase RsbU (regulator of sigma subunit)
MLSKEQILGQFKDKIAAIADKRQVVREIVDFTQTYSDTLGGIIAPLLHEGILIAKEISDKSGEVLCRYNLRFLDLFTKGNNASMDTEELQALENLQKEIEDNPEAYILALNYKAYNYWFRGEYDKGFEYLFSALKMSDSSPSLSLGWNYYALGVFYYDTRDLENSELYYDKALHVFATLNYLYGAARARTGLGTVAVQKDRFSEARALLTEAAATYREVSHASGLSRALNDLGMIEKRSKNYPAALELFEESAQLRRELQHYQGLITTYTEMGELYIWIGNYEVALELMNKALELAVEAGARQKRARLHKLLAEVYKQTGETEQALNHLESYYELTTGLMSDESTNNIKKIQSRFEKEKAEQIAEIERLKNVELKAAYEIIERKNKDIEDSIHYARRIQQGILPSDENIGKCFRDVFVFYRPKDIVSGDFYWLSNTTSEKNGNAFTTIAAVDCTGHGVPGAFMSVLGNTLLNQTIFNREIVYPNQVLDYLNQELPRNLKSYGQELSIRDGMDMALCSFDLKNKTLYFSGANNPCWVFRKDEIIELNADKQAISAGTDFEKKPFRLQEFKLNSGDLVVLFTDGFADQFGGPKGKKFKYKTLKELLQKHSLEPLEKIKQNLQSTFEAWKGELEQVDDVCLIGIRI